MKQKTIEYLEFSLKLSQLILYMLLIYYVFSITAEPRVTNIILDGEDVIDHIMCDENGVCG